MKKDEIKRHLECMVEGNTYKMWVERHQRKKPVITLSLNLREMWCENVDWINGLRITVQCQPSVNSGMNHKKWNLVAHHTFMCPYRQKSRGPRSENLGGQGYGPP
jgi:hypothetical protein